MLQNKEIRRLLAHFNLEVNRLIRTHYGPYRLGNIPRGAALRVPVLPEILRGARDLSAGRRPASLSAQHGRDGRDIDHAASD